MVVTTIALDKDIHQALARIAFEDQIALTELVRRAVRKWLAHRRKAPKR